MEMVQNLSVIRGDTLFSPVWTFVNEEIPKDLSLEDFKKGIEAGTYTFIDLAEFEITSNVRKQYNGDKIYDLTQYLVAKTGYLSFILPSTATESLANERQSLLYDIQFKEKVTGYVKTLISGTLEITQDVTYKDVQPTTRLGSV